MQLAEVKSDEEVVDVSAPADSLHLLRDEKATLSILIRTVFLFWSVHKVYF